MKREQTCCFTGHRPEKLPWGTDETDPRCAALKTRILDAVETAYDSGMRLFYCGMARGCDFYFAEAVLALRGERSGMKLAAVVPCLSQARYWPSADQLRWREILDACDGETLIQEAYTAGCMMRRNRYMVDHSALLIAASSGQKGGTLRTLEYALRKKINIMDIFIQSD
ncbi:MAG: DUF1273 domain-containing protein [Oscillospiraceae bacterium]|nr:DUF1273 domain-containing protein [Oscillospiraceae bacterium]